MATRSTKHIASADLKVMNNEELLDEFSVWWELQMKAVANAVAVDENYRKCRDEVLFRMNPH